MNKERCSLILRDIYLSRGVCALLQFFLCHETSLSCSVANDHTSLLHRLNVALVVAADTITDCHKVKVRLVEHVPMLGREHDHTESQTVVVLLLL
jgi:hypothetical protein